ncbi:MAG: hypothetical protein SGI77_26260 [Pirellulaceae bacterium]|nr:hypothetical protein [Pirellulaceae bacterium]
MLLANFKSLWNFGFAGTLILLPMSSFAFAIENTGRAHAHKPESPKSETRFIKFEKVPIHCGPAIEHYVTGYLTRGEVVEIYHQTKDGWCGIRPPAGSHDWLAADQAYLLPGGKQAEVVGNKTPAWIGAETIAEKQRFRWQIELQPSQKVDVIGEIEQAVDSEKVRLWYKILPPSGEFRWIRAEGLSTTPIKERSSTVTLANAHQAKSATKETAEQVGYVSPVHKKSSQSSLLVRPAVANQYPSNAGVPEPIPMLNNDSRNSSHGEVIEREPVVGEYIEGEGRVINSPPHQWEHQGSYTIGNEHFAGDAMDQGVVIDGNGFMIDGDDMAMDGNEWIVDGGGVPCATCDQVGCTSCAASHQTDSFQQWDSVEAIGNPKLRFRPISKIFGLIGLSIVEGERVEDAACPIGCRCARCGNGTATLHPRSSGRFDHLPRPNRRTYGDFPNDFLGAKDYSRSSSNSFDRSLLSRSPLPEPSSSSGTRNWHGIAPASLGSNLDSTETDNFASRSNPRSLLNSESTSVSPVSGQSEELHFSTPEIQQAMIELTHVVADSIDRWDLRAHAARAQQWIEQAADPIARGEARLLLERIESFEILRQRAQSGVAMAYAAIPSSNSADNPTTAASLIGFQRPVDNIAQPTSSNDVSMNNAAVIQRNSDGTPSSDASGWLVEVHSAEYGQPQFALTDDYGGLIAYVQPSPGMNLIRYLKQPVGVYGVKGYLPNLSARQIVVERIVRLR